ncbi:MAG: CinA family protein [Anaerolineae bacterium]
MSNDDLPQSLGSALQAAGLSLCTAESCTGGLIADMVTDIPGASLYFAGGVVAYANHAKRDVLGVPSTYLEAFGAVSAPVALAMARGGRRLFHCDIALSATGIAGPSGSTAGKPVGLVYVAIVAPNYAACQELYWSSGRRNNKEATARAALAMALAYLQRR